MSRSQDRSLRPALGARQWRAAPKILFDIRCAAFVPPPKVTSALVRLVPRRALRAAIAALERVTAAAFGQRRKMLRQSLKSLGRRSGGAGDGGTFIELTRRAETVPVSGFVAMARELMDIRASKAP